MPSCWSRTATPSCRRAASTRTLPFFRLFPSLAALTTDEDCLVPGGRCRHARLAPAALRPAPSADVLAGPVAAADHASPGRMSVYRAAVATDPGFIELIGNDTLDHWRFGRLRLLTGEDKSAAYWLLERGLTSLYVPDVQVLTIEQPPAPDLLRASTALMLRWFGNMLRASGRCLALGPGRVGWFVWWCLVDQRISMWTPLVGPIAAILLAIAVTPAFLYAYLLWVMATRLIQSLLLLTVRPTHQRPLPAAALLLPALRRAAQDLGPVSARSPALDSTEHRPDALAHPGTGALAGRGIAGPAPAGPGDPGRRRGLVHRPGTLAHFRPACPLVLGIDDEAADRPRSRDPPPACAAAHPDRGRDRRHALRRRRLVDGRARGGQPDHARASQASGSPCG